MGETWCDAGVRVTYICGTTIGVVCCFFFSMADSIVSEPDCIRGDVVIKERES